MPESSNLMSAIAVSCRLAVLVASTMLVFAGACGSRRGENVHETWEASNHILKIRIRKFDERWPFLPHNYFTVETAAAGSEKWRERLSWRGDEGTPIYPEQVQMVNEQFVYAFATTTYVVTTDAGATWSEWDAERKLPSLPYPGQVALLEPRVSADGRGTMVLHYRDKNGFTKAQLNTTDYGVRWTLK